MSDTTSQITKSSVTTAPIADHVIAIASGKGGVGKTWLATTLAHLIARSGRKVLLFDGDIGLANVDVQLGLTPERDLNSYFAGKMPLSKVPFTYDVGGYDIIAGRSGSGVLSRLGTDRLQQFAEDMHDIATNYETILLDLGAGVENHVRYLSGLAARCLVVITEEPTSLTDAYAFIKLCRREHTHTRMEVVVNQAATQREGEKTYNALQTACTNFLQFSPPLAGVIRRDNKVRDAIRHQSPIVIRSPNCTAATDVAALSVKVMTKS